jgi:triosephosphate isomerase
MAAEVHARLRGEIADRFGPAFAASLRILYGGSLSPESAPGLFAEAEVDGGLVGGASLVAGDVAALLAAAAAPAARA